MKPLDTIITFIAARGGTVTRTQLNDALNELLGEDGGGTRSALMNVIRALNMLGIGDAIPGGNSPQIRLSRPCWAKLPGIGAHQAVLTGARTPQTVSEIESKLSTFEGVRLHRHDHPLPESPFACVRVSLEAQSDSLLADAAESTGVHLTANPAAWELACAGEDVATFASTISWSDYLSVPSHAQDWHVESLRYSSTPSKSEIRLCTWGDASTGRSEYALSSSKGIIRLPPPFLSIARHFVISDSSWTWLRYNRREQLFACPAQAPVPEILSRALTLCTGRLPDFLFTNNGRVRWLAWTGVTPAVAEKWQNGFINKLHPLSTLKRSGSQ